MLSEMEDGSDGSRSHINEIKEKYTYATSFLYIPEGWSFRF